METEGQISQESTMDLEKGSMNGFPKFAVWVLVLTLFLMVIFGLWYLVEKNSIKKINNNISSVNTEIAGMKDLEDQMQVYSGAAANMQSALSQKKKVSTVFKKISATLVKDVVITDISVDQGGSATISGQAPSVTSLSKLLVAFNNSQDFSGVSLGSFSYQKGAVAFTITTVVRGEG